MAYGLGGRAGSGFRLYTQSFTLEENQLLIQGP